MKRSEVEQVPWQEVESSNIARVAWVATGDPDEFYGTLWVEFKGGRTYRYEGVEKRTFDTLLDADSIGRYFAHVIKARPDQYPVERVEVEDE